MLRRLRRILLIVLAALVGLLAIAALSLTVALRGSLPRLDGRRDLPGVQAPVVVTRDSLGVPDIVAAGRTDAVRALGYLHAQDRFFQMDLLRRSAAGELAELVGPAAAGLRPRHRRHRFRRRAEGRRRTAASARERANSSTPTPTASTPDWQRWRAAPGVPAPAAASPEPWRAEDTVLTLVRHVPRPEWSTGATERSLGRLRDNLPPALVDFLAAARQPMGRPVARTAPLPTGRCRTGAWTSTLRLRRAAPGHERHARGAPHADSAGSNNWAVAGPLTAHGGALLANDMHLGLGLPNIWYRARFGWPEADGRRSLVGVTLPGTPALVVGSNGRGGLGLHQQLRRLARPGDRRDRPRPTRRRYRTPDGWRPFERDEEIIDVRAAADTLEVRETIWGPVSTTDSRGRPRALRWIAHDTEAVNLARGPGNRPQRRRGGGPGRPHGHPARRTSCAATRRPHRLDHRRPHAPTRGLRRSRAGVLGRRHPPLGRLARPRRVPGRRRSSRGPALDRQQPVVDGRLGHRRRRLRPGRPRAARSATTCWRWTGPPQPTCWRSSWTTGPCSSSGGASCCCRCSNATRMRSRLRGPFSGMVRDRWEGRAADRLGVLPPGARLRLHVHRRGLRPEPDPAATGIRTSPPATCPTGTR